MEGRKEKEGVEGKRKRGWKGRGRGGGGEEEDGVEGKRKRG